MLPLRTVLCALDFSDGSARALARAADLAERSHATLRLLHVDPTFRARLAEVPGGDVGATYRARLAEYVNRALGSDDAFEVLGPDVIVRHGEPAAEGILAEAETSGADLVVVGTHARSGLGHVLLGSVAAEVLRQSDRPVLVVPEVTTGRAPGPMRPVLVGVDFSPHTPAVLALARGLAEAYGAPLELAHVLEGAPEATVDFGGLFTLSDLRSERSEGARVLAERGLERLAADASGVARVHALAGVAETELVRLAQARDAGALVLGTHGRTGFDRLLLGSVAEYAVRHAPCGVLTVSARAAARATAEAARASGAAA